MEVSEDHPVDLPRKHWKWKSKGGQRELTWRQRLGNCQFGGGRSARAQLKPALQIQFPREDTEKRRETHKWKVLRELRESPAGSD